MKGKDMRILEYIRKTNDITREECICNNLKVKRNLKYVNQRERERERALAEMV